MELKEYNEKKQAILDKVANPYWKNEQIMKLNEERYLASQL
jgi:hypothetical protein